ncbi:glycosyltransferase [bacterium]|nr:glycosyltransferase [bacterium]
MISIIIPAKDQIELTKESIISILESTKTHEFEIILINNGSKPEFREYFETLSKKDKRLNIVDSFRSSSFSELCNKGAMESRGEYLIFLNNDTKGESGWIEALLSPFEDEKVGIVGSRLLFEDGTIQHDGIVLPLWLFPFNNNRDIPAKSLPDNGFKEVFAVTGACLMIKRALFFKLNGFDENYIWRLEDVDLCMKARKLGYKIICSRLNNIYHFESRTPIPQKIQNKVIDSFYYFTKKWKRYFKPRVERKILELRKRNINRIVIFGTGFAGELLAGTLIEFNFKIACIIESERKKKRDKLMGIKIMRPEELAHLNYDSILIASQFTLKVKQFLREHHILEKIEVPILEE